MSRRPSTADPVPSSPGMSLACEAVAFSYEEGRQKLPALRDVTFGLAPGGSLALLGASGAGKSTLLQVVKGLDEAEAGAVVLDGLQAWRRRLRARSAPDRPRVPDRGAAALRGLGP